MTSATATPLRGRHVVVTGAASGIGEAVAHLALERGAQVTSLDVRQPSVGVTQHLSCDLGDPASIDMAVAGIDGAVDALCNVAGLPGTHPDDLVFAVNFLGLRHLTESLLPRIRAGGAVVNVSSTAGLQWPARLETILGVIATAGFAEGRAWFASSQPRDVPAYFFSKEVVTVYTMHRALSAGANGVRMNALSPGPVDTPILADFEASMGKDVLDGVRAMIGRHASPENLAALVLFLASQDARWVNGTNLIADGGMTGAVMSGAVPLPTQVT